MTSAVAEELRADLRARFGRLSPEERLMLVLDLGRRDVAIYAAARCVDPGTAADVLQAARRAGRRPSGCREPRSD